jgi:hypothetical protein
MELSEKTIKIKTISRLFIFKKDPSVFLQVLSDGFRVLSCAGKKRQLSFEEILSIGLNSLRKIGDFSFVAKKEKSLKIGGIKAFYVR